MRTKILLVDDHPMMRRGLRAEIERQPRFDVVGEAGDGQTALALADELQPEVVVMDVALPGLTGVETTRRLVEDHPGLKVIALSLHDDRRYVLAMLRAGAAAYLLKTNAAEQLIQAVDAVVAGRAFLCPEIAAVAVGALGGGGEAPERPGATSLTGRQREVLRHLADGLSSKEIARELGVTSRTVDSHRREIMRRLDLHSVAQLVKYAIREGLTSLE